MSTSNIEKIIIKNKKGQRLVVIVEKNDNPRGLAFVMHGLSGNKDQLHILTFDAAFKEKDYTVVRFDTTNTYGESDGKYEDATVTSYYEDLEDVINWTKTQPWFTKPFCLAGHSLGGISIILYAEKYPEEIKGLAPISTVVSGKLSLKTHAYREDLKHWQKTGWREEASKSRSGLIKKLPWSHMVDRLKYDVVPDAYKLKMPVLMIVGDNDESTPPEHQKILYERLPEKKELHIIKNCPHTFTEPAHLLEIKQIFLKWIDTL